MTDVDRAGGNEMEPSETATGPNLKLFFGLIALALAAALAIALLIVLPFYHRR